MSDFVVEIVGDKTFTPKATSVPVFDKTIDDAQLPKIEGIEDGGTYDLGTIIDIKEDEVLYVNDEIKETPFEFGDEGDYIVMLEDGNGRKSTINIKIKSSCNHEWVAPNLSVSYSYEIPENLSSVISHSGNNWTMHTMLGTQHNYNTKDIYMLFYYDIPEGADPVTITIPVTGWTCIGKQQFFEMYGGRDIELTRTLFSMYCENPDGGRSKVVSKATSANITLNPGRNVITAGIRGHYINYNSEKAPNNYTKMEFQMPTVWINGDHVKHYCRKCGLKADHQYDSNGMCVCGYATVSPSTATTTTASAVSTQDYASNGFELNMLPVAMATEMDGTDNTDKIDDRAVSDDENTDTTVRYGAGDSIPFKLTAVMPDSISAYEAYQLVFHDSMTDGLTYDEGSIKVFVGDTEIPAENYMVASDDGMKSFTVTINDAKVEPFNAVAGTEVSVKYSATLNDGAVFRNVNNAYLEYSNNPNGEGTGTTVSDDVTAFTFELNIDKVDKDGNALAGAGFTLYKKTADGYVQFGDEVTGGTDFSFGGLAVGDYKLVESTTPDGYNTMEDLEFSVVADSMEDADGNAYVTGLKIIAQGGTLDSNMIEGWTADTDTGMLSADIANYRGSELPSTGGMGTMMFYVVGGCIMAVVCFILVKRKEQCAK